MCFRLKSDQQEFVDHRGLHVVVGHYLGDANNVVISANLTDGKCIITRNNNTILQHKRYSVLIRVSRSMTTIKM